MRSLIVVGPYKGATGHGHHTREFVRELVNQGIRVQLCDMLGWGPGLAPTMSDPWFNSLTGLVDAEIVLHFAMPHQVQPVPDKRNVNYTMFEATRIPAKWVAHNMQHDRVLVPTESSYRAWRDSGVPEERLRICPLGIDADLFSRHFLPLNLAEERGKRLDTYQYRFLNVAELRPRKNHLGLLRSWLRATNSTDDAVLILKLVCFQDHLMKQFVADLQAAQEQLGKSLPEAAPIHFLTSFFPDEAMPRLYTTATHYISMSLGEGWDLPMMEAAGSGLRLIAPDHSAYTAYLNDSVAHLISSPEAPAVFEGLLGREDAVFFGGLRWWRPSEDQAVDVIRQIIDGNEPEKASPRKYILETYTWKKAATRLIELLEELL
jgi:glycosyltransferase involved in cell wall biosynthesis